MKKKTKKSMKPITQSSCLIKRKREGRYETTASKVRKIVTKTKNEKNTSKPPKKK